MDYDVYRYIYCTLHTNKILQKYGLKLTPKSLREFIASVLCKWDDGCIYYKTMRSKCFCFQCGGLKKLYRCLHLDNTHEIGKTLVSLGRYK